MGVQVSSRWIEVVLSQSRVHPLLGNKRTIQDLLIKVNTFGLSLREAGRRNHLTQEPWSSVLTNGEESLGEHILAEGTV